MRFYINIMFNSKIDLNLQFQSVSSNCDENHSNLLLLAGGVVAMASNISKIRNIAIDKIIYNGINVCTCE